MFHLVSIYVSHNKPYTIKGEERPLSMLTNRKQVEGKRNREASVCGRVQVIFEEEVEGILMQNSSLPCGH